MPDALRVAAMDCGTNSLRLLVTDVRGDQKRDVVREMRVVRLGQGVDETGRFHPDALERTLAVTREFGELATVLGAERVRFCATSAARDASNADELSDGVRSVLGIDLEVLSGEEEARASFLGATRSVSGPALVVDIGGGSTELVVGADGDVGWSHSFDVGSVRLTERFLRSDPASIDEVTALESYLDDVLTPRLSGLDPVSTLVGVAGTITTVAAHALELPSYDSSQIHGARIAVDDVRTACVSLLRMSVADRRALPFMHPGRADVIGAGAMILDAVLASVPLATDEVLVSEHDILDGIAWGAAQRSA
ncbi:exopolyphosphatase/guanosine-5'-triphosphate,3'-diphosphate pyrophosphatase [Aeromicrobium sp. SORGH_AS981]|uniref:Ppx/GppA phosphatase family protein n=1 Tax=Aeromicrobium sp. SORGH_AS_0981 TaxID=3041802 RepID=UPI00285D9AAC|nr:Ppx/GppA phosphatase family protein [Aeromicrobium sp. SORGH_AS_0981]MDR6116981.1 exopolyphosphatase/guanosine-5'-triphosphate,3'-diphosphate pyrophosphatase [Aeromicrobium sp. SORGH_AS_0981]